MYREEIKVAVIFLINIYILFIVKKKNKTYDYKKIQFLHFRIKDVLFRDIKFVSFLFFLIISSES